MDAIAIMAQRISFLIAEIDYGLNIQVRLALLVKELRDERDSTEYVEKYEHKTSTANGDVFH